MGIAGHLSLKDNACELKQVIINHFFQKQISVQLLAYDCSVLRAHFWGDYCNKHIFWIYLIMAKQE